jgi:hypothetical protein
MDKGRKGKIIKRDYDGSTEISSEHFVAAIREENETGFDLRVSWDSARRHEMPVNMG